MWLFACQLTDGKTSKLSIQRWRLYRPKDFFRISRFDNTFMNFISILGSTNKRPSILFLLAEHQKVDTSADIELRGLGGGLAGQWKEVLH